ncbi:hypothetical protein [Undibacterium sp. RuTC16W]|uniref:hypothetical protein n=1 Tax=Undibacterium sp. RuTC16W TaxID=3413048 RepID=UPI003BF2753F
MLNRVAAILAVVGTTIAFAADAPNSYLSAKATWERTKDDTKYQAYAAEFAQFNNHFHLDEKDGCYSLAPGPVNLMLVITRPAKSEYAVIERVLSDVENAKAQCFKKSYGGVKTKAPPFVPFVLQMQMG